MCGVAQEQGVAILDPENINTEESRDRIATLQPDLLVVADYGQILRPETLAVARLGGINLHGSLLPKYRGAAPINWALYHGEKETGVTVIQMSPCIDAGGCLAQARLAIDPDETAVELEARLAALGAPLVVQCIDQLEAGTIHPAPQDPALASKAPRLKKSDGAVNWSRSARRIKNQVRAMDPWPKTYTYWLRAGHEPLRLILGRVAALEGDTHPLPGTVVHAHIGDLVVSSGGGLLRIESLQPAGKRMLPVEEFLRGYPVQPGERFGDAGDSR
jgi:methionyl-tRNA formyltransferase